VEVVPAKVGDQLSVLSEKEVFSRISQKPLPSVPVEDEDVVVVAVDAVEESSNSSPASLITEEERKKARLAEASVAARARKASRGTGDLPRLESPSGKFQSQM
jgi:hypothetical protein